MDDRPRLIEVAFPLKETSIDSVHEKNVRHGHISTLHIWPARRPLAACRAALIATLLSDPGNDEERKKLLEKIGGKVIVNPKTGREETEGGILHWGRESGPDMDWFRAEIRKAYGGRAPRVLDPFAGGGAIPLEAMRLGCEVTAVDINPVAWFLLKCTLEYPQKLSGKKLPLPEFALRDRPFMTAFLKAHGHKGAELTKTLDQLGFSEAGKTIPMSMVLGDVPPADLAWHVRAWGNWVLGRARNDLERFYPIVDGKPTVAYLWARTVRCKGCGGTIPLLKTRWLCKKEGNRLVLAIEPRKDRSGVEFSIATATAEQAKDKAFATGTMSRSGAKCPYCPAIMTAEDIRLEAQAGKLGAAMSAVVVEGKHGKEYRSPTAQDFAAAESAVAEIAQNFQRVPFGVPDEPVPQGSSRESGGSAFTVHLYGLDRWSRLFTARQLLALGTFIRHCRDGRNAMNLAEYSPDWIEALVALLAISLDRLADRSSSLCRPESPARGGAARGIINTFSRFALSMNWDFVEAVTIEPSSGGFPGAIDWVAKVAEHCGALGAHPIVNIARSSVLSDPLGEVDVIVTDPPYYDAIPYADLMDFFYVWLRRSLAGVSSEYDRVFAEPLAPKWDHLRNDGELIDDASRFDGNKTLSKQSYEDGMARAFRACHRTLVPEGRLVIVFAHKQPDAWETLVGAIIRSGFVVDGSWPIQTEMITRTRAQSAAALSASVWLVCKKRPESAGKGWDNRVLEDMRERIKIRLRAYWDAGIRGPDVVWAATGPALEAYSKYPVVRKVNEPGQVMTVSEFLRHVRRIVVDFVVGRVLTQSGGEAVSGLDDVTTYYLLHRHDFRMADAPAGASILYAVSCDLSDRDLSDRFDLLVRTGGKAAVEEEPEGEDAESDEDVVETSGGSGNKVKLKAWDQRRGKNLGLDTEGKPAPLIDQIHRLMHLWSAGDQIKVNQYLDMRALWKNQICHQVLQALIELAPEGSQERSILESISNHLGVKGKGTASKQLPLPPHDPTDT